MMLYATGFNAWNQLQFDSGQSDANAFEDAEDEPNDLESFTCVLDQDVDRVSPFFSYTIAHLSNGQDLIAGSLPKDHARLRALKRPPTLFAEASNGIVAVVDPSTGVLHQHPSLSSLVANDPPTHTFPNLTPITQLLAYSTGFAALTSTSEVLTWGDERYPACLGREPTPERPANLPTPLPSLTSLPTGPITTFSCCGSTLAALTAGNDLYVWGSTTAAGQRGPLLPDLSPDGIPTPVVIFDENDDDRDQEGKDILDVAVGEEHMVVLTTAGEVFVVGGNGSGQLGTGGWRRVRLEGVVRKGRRVKGVAAGARSSFLLVD
ncbi:E3 ubiquitin-protein ligase HERC2 [Staphylotrichum tortipilum]|uniref:E3 ubiquitin-protein ligase HERC2 n=1 Tax=Staphylotrichum tortipilum TaxID=2831512 RepID=A0AAN6MGG9_9PEZI|nr:E3 ubiquitin-protein ligase HERC2 [Staphylotrichum longicolle]